MLFMGSLPFGISSTASAAEAMECELGLPGYETFTLSTKGKQVEIRVKGAKSWGPTLSDYAAKLGVSVDAKKAPIDEMVVTFDKDDCKRSSRNQFLFVCVPEERGGYSNISFLSKGKSFSPEGINHEYFHISERRYTELTKDRGEVSRLFYLFELSLGRFPGGGEMLVAKKTNDLYSCSTPKYKGEGYQPVQ
jgi:hypothetical protein